MEPMRRDMILVVVVPTPGTACCLLLYRAWDHLEAHETVDQEANIWKRPGRVKAKGVLPRRCILSRGLKRRPAPIRKI